MIGEKRKMEIEFFDTIEELYQFYDCLLRLFTSFRRMLKKLSSGILQIEKLKYDIMDNLELSLWILVYEIVIIGLYSFYYNLRKWALREK